MDQPRARIRAARMEDVTAIARTHVATWRATYRGIVAQSFLDALDEERQAERWAASLGRREVVVLVAERAGEVVGHASLGPVRTTPDAAYTAELYSLYLLPEQHGGGIGRALVVAGARRLLASGHRSMMVWVLRDNPSRGFYERMGGRYLGSQPVAIGEEELTEWAYGWPDLTPLARLPVPGVLFDANMDVVR
jgi:L-amino acid N-acyltransferase YncA